MLRVQTAVGSDIRETDLAFRKVEAYVTARPEVTRCFAVVGGMGGGVNGGIVFVSMVDKRDRKLSQAEFAAEIRKELNSYPGVRVVVQDLSQSGFTAQRGFPVEFSVRGPDWDVLVEKARGISEKLNASGQVVDLDMDYRIGMPELRIAPNRARSADLGISVENVATALNATLGGLRIGKYSTEGRRIDVRLRLLAGQRTRPEDLSRLRLRSNAGDLIPLSSLVTTEEVPALQAITRRDRERAITIYANVAPGMSQADVLKYVEGLGTDMPTGYRLVLGGASVAFRESMGDLLFALVLGIGVAYMVLASQFNSFWHPVTILLALPFSISGALFALWIGGQSLNVYSMLGVILLVGIAKKNSIMLVDFTNQVRELGVPHREALLQACPIRLRPILMTSIATIAGALPPALAIGPGAEIQRPMALALVGGMAVSTLLTLFVVPAGYSVLDDALEWGRGRRREGTGPVGVGGNLPNETAKTAGALQSSAVQGETR
jgi:multidrug efflux pump subunit AcrB